MQAFLPLYINETALRLSNREMYRVFTHLHILQRYCTPSISILGLVLNIFTLLITTRGQLRISSLQPYIIALACCDTLFLSMVILEWGGTDERLALYSTEGFCQAMTYITAVCMAASGWLVFTIQLDRFLFHFTHNHKYLCTRIKAKFVTVSILAVAIVVYLNISLLYTVSHVWNNVYNCSPIYSFKSAVHVFERVEMAVIFGAPYLGLLVLLTAIGVKIVSKKLGKGNEASKEQCVTNDSKKAGRCEMRREVSGWSSTPHAPPLLPLSLALSAFFLLFTVPAFTVNLIINILTEPAYQQHLTLAILLVQQFLQTLFYYRCALTFFIYLTFDSSFRQTAAHIVMCRSAGSRRCCKQTTSNGREIEDVNYRASNRKLSGGVQATEV